MFEVGVYDYFDKQTIPHKVLYENTLFRILSFFALMTMMIKMHYLMRVFIGVGKIVKLVSKVFDRSY
jgi:hypothetical protein